MNRIWKIVSLLVMVLAWPAEARIHQYGASANESAWIHNGSAVYCRLSHEIPAYGTAVFSQSVDEELQFSISVKRTPRTKDLHASLQAVAPEWKHGASSQDLGSVAISKTARPFSMGRDMARRLFLELEEGMFPTLYYSDWADGQNNVNVSISAVNFRKARGEFLQCLAGLLPYGFKEIRNSRVYFEYDKSRLTKKTRQQLDKVAKYVTNSPDEVFIEIEGHTDARGFRRYNQKLSLARANTVREYFKKLGIADALMQIRGFGELRPAKSNRTSKGRALNRRVVINLMK